MALLKSSMLACPREAHCSNWARTHMNYCLCSVRDGVSLMLGLISVISWGVAEIPQIITNYQKKSTEGLSIAFLTTWILGDLFNLFGCMLEPATLPTQYYMAMLYTLTTMILGAQTIYYCHICPYLKCKRTQKGLEHSHAEAAEKGKQRNNNVGLKQVNHVDRSDADIFDKGNILSSPIPLPLVHQNISPGRELYYMSARSLSRSHTPTAGSCLAQRMAPPAPFTESSIEEPLLTGHISTQSAPPPTTKTMLCLVSAITFLGTFNLPSSENSGFVMASEKGNQGLVMRIRRKLVQFQADAGFLLEHGYEENSEIGTFLGWAMAAIYMGGRLPQICLNIRRGNVEGLNPLMFFFALVGNATYVASVLVSSLEWSRIRPNLPWLVDAGGCVLLDTFILTQFIYFRYWSPQDSDDIHENSDAA